AGDAMTTFAMDSSTSGTDGNDGARDAGNREADDANVTGAHADASDSGPLQSDGSRDAASSDAASSTCSGAAICVPLCDSSPCGLDCANAGTCNVTCQAGQTCNIDCGSAGTCNVTCQAGAR